MRVYLAGPIDGQTYEGATDWRNKFRYDLRAIGHEGLSPMRGKEYLAKEETIIGAYENFPLSSEQGIFGRDLYDVRSCDVLLANLLPATKASIGTAMEVAIAYENHKYIIVVLEPGSVSDHPFIRRAASVVVTSLDEAYDVIAILGGHA